MAYRINKNALFSDTSPSEGWQRLSVSKSLGECYIDRLTIEPGLSIAYSSYTPNRDLIEESIIDKNSTTFSLTYGLEGHSCYRPDTDTNEELIFSSNHTTLATFGNITGKRVYKANQTVSQLRILVDANVFNRYQIPFDQDASKLSTPQQHWHDQTSHHTQHYIKRLMNLMISNNSERPLEKNILVLNLLSEQLSLLKTPNESQRQPKINHQNEHQIVQAKHFMIQNMNQPLTLAYISQQVGLSESKLKTGFKALYQTSPYKMLLEMRMMKAWELLESGYQVAQTAYAVGYEHPSNFSAAFSQFYERTPKSLSSIKH
ncbi:AraC family transcriptional regulator [Marinomonas sp.]|nr:AraC family transcriptional regulator [Marinomonas sp.]MDB4836992.1 AraC family transcriptional regulator [Marinomonas sp.]